MCYFCGTEFTDRVYRNTECPSCGKDLKICLNCRFYEPGAQWDCRESIGEPVREKDRANFCDFYEYVYRPRKGAGSDTGSSDTARNRFNSLFSDE